MIKWTFTECIKISVKYVKHIVYKQKKYIGGGEYDKMMLAQSLIAIIIHSCKSQTVFFFDRLYCHLVYSIHFHFLTIWLQMMFYMKHTALNIILGKCTVSSPLLNNSAFLYNLNHLGDIKVFDLIEI